MISSQEIFQNMMKLPEYEGTISGPSHSFLSNLFRKTFRGVPKGRRFYFNMKRPLFRDAIVVVDAPITHTYEDVQKWINHLYRDYVVKLHPDRWEYIFFWDDYTLQRYGIYECLESARNEKDKIQLDYYFKIKGVYEGQPPIIGRKKKEGVNKNPLGLIEGKTRLRIGENKLFTVIKLIEGSSIVELRLENPGPRDSIIHQLPMKSIIERIKK